jgi:ubiquinone/menaquinone biosynthesis C-methylase UbiE
VQEASISNEQTRRWALQVLVACGVRPTMILGRGARQVAAELRVSGVPASCGSLDHQYGSANAVAALYYLDDLSEDEIDAAFEQWHAIGACLYLLIAAACPRTRVWWEQKLFRAGFRKHPAYYDHVHYETLDNEQSDRTIVMEPVPDSALALYPYDWLLNEPLSHTDMMRVSGRRSDAHVFRYALAARYILPGDAVLDTSSGYGYGSYLMMCHSPAAHVIGLVREQCMSYANSSYSLPGKCEFRQDSLEELAGLADNSFDLVVSFETLQHIPKPEDFIAEAYRVLRPGGRFIACVPNQWVDQSDRGPKPTALHVYDWPLLRAQVCPKFILERAWSQVAGGAFKLADHPRRMTAFDPDGELSIESEWLLLMGRKSPMSGLGVPFVDTLHSMRPDTEANVTAFQRDYSNPWLVRGLASIGARLESQAALGDLAYEVITANARMKTADLGAAICVRAYLLIGAAEPEATSVEHVLNLITEYLDGSPDNPTALRWQVSNSYALGVLLARGGRMSEAEVAWRKCVSYDATIFDRLLLTKTLEAHYRLALISAARADPQQAKAHLLASLKAVEHGFKASLASSVGTLEYPNSFGFNECAQIFVLAHRAAAAMRFLDVKGELSGFVFHRLYETNPWLRNDALFHEIEACYRMISTWYVPHIERLETALDEARSTVAALQIQLQQLR